MCKNKLFKRVKPHYLKAVFIAGYCVSVASRSGFWMVGYIVDYALQNRKDRFSSCADLDNRVIVLCIRKFFFRFGIRKDWFVKHRKAGPDRSFLLPKNQSSHLACCSSSLSRAVLVQPCLTSESTQSCTFGQA